MIVRDDFAYEPSENRIEWPGNFGKYRIVVNIYFVGMTLLEKLLEFEKYLDNSDLPYAKMDGEIRHKSDEVNSTCMISLNEIKDRGFILRALMSNASQATGLRDIVSDFLQSSDVTEFTPWNRHG